MKKEPSKKREWSVTQEAFDNLLKWLDPNRDKAAIRYEDLRRRLIKIFTVRGSTVPEDLADETINRVTKRVADLEKSYVGDPAIYFYGVARMVQSEYARRKPDSQLHEEYYKRIRENELNMSDMEVIQPEEDTIALALVRNRIKPVALRADGSYRFLDSALNLHRLIYVATAETLGFRMAVEELGTLVNDPKTKEEDLQKFFERHPDFIVNDEYRKAHPHVVLTKTDGEILIPDFVLEPIDQNPLCDLLELKLPSSRVFVLKKRRKRFSSAVLEACAQLRTYSEFFDEETNRNNIKERYGLLAYKPKLFVIIGRRADVSPIDQRKIESDVPYLLLRTYDDVLIRAKMRLEAMIKGRVKA